MQTDKGNHILIVDDNAAMRETWKLMLELEGYQTLEAANGKEALELLNNIDAPLLILLDVMMPIMNGYQFAEKILENKKTAEIPIVLLTAYPEEAHHIKNAKSILSKPVDMNILYQTIKEAAQR